MTLDTIKTGLLRLFGLNGLNRTQQVTYEELMNLSDRQLEDIGLTRALIETVVLQGPEAVHAVNPHAALHRPANADGAAVGAA